MFRCLHPICLRCNFHKQLDCRQTFRVSLSSAIQARRKSPSLAGGGRGSPRTKTRQHQPTKKTLDELVVPVQLKYDGSSSSKNEAPSPVGDVGAELTGTIGKSAMNTILNDFLKRPEIRKLCEQNGLSEKLFNQAFVSFRMFCQQSKPLPPELHVLFFDLTQNKAHVDDLFPYFMKHARRVFPHLECLDDLQKISDLRQPQNWYVEARAIHRKIVFHAGPANSGKTYEALQRFFDAESGVYCGPLKMLASEIYHTSHKRNIKCDLITGEERRFASPDGEPSQHISCTIEMLNTSTPFDVAIIDEIQMIRDLTRGWAWTRALLGVCAREIHLCGEASAVDLVNELLYPIGEEVEIFKYKRKTPLRVLDEPLKSFDNIKHGDCIVAFSKNDIYSISREIAKAGQEVAVIYGSLPPATKFAQAEKFNDTKSNCNVMVATDAIGMGLNLNIKRIIFWSLCKPNTTSTGERDVEYLTPSQALQIAGRAGRFGTAHESGEVTTFKKQDLPILKQILATKIDNIDKAGLYPTLEQIEMFSFFLPQATLSNLMDIFVSLCSVDESKYFMCNIEDFKCLAEMIEHVPNLSLKTRYIFCLAPINRRNMFVSQQFVKFARRFSTGDPLTWAWLADSLEWPLQTPQRIADLIHLEAAFDVIDMYLWLGYRFMDMFPDCDYVREKQLELDQTIREGVLNIMHLLKNSSLNLDEELSTEERRLKAAKPETIVDEEASIPEPAAVTREQLIEDGLSTNLSQNRIPFVLQSHFKGQISDSPITTRLISQGLLTPSILRELEREWELRQGSPSSVLSPKTKTHKKDHKNTDKRTKK